MDPPNFALPPAVPDAAGAPVVSLAPAAPPPARAAALKKPKRPKTAYHFFYEARRKEELDKAPVREEVDNNALSKQLGVEWKAMDPTTRRPWDVLAEGARAEYDQLVREFKAGGGSMDAVTPSKPLSAYMLYFRAKHQQQPGGPVTDFAKATGREWKGLPDSAKQPFYDAARAQRDLYDKQVAFCSKQKAALVDEKFLDSRESSKRFGCVRAYDPSADHGGDDGGAAYAVEYDDSPGRVETLCLAELRARVCGDERAAKRAASKLEASAKKRRSEDPQAPSTVALPPAPPPKKPKAAKPKKIAPAVPDDEPPPLADSEILNVVRLSRRLVGGASVANLKRMCGAAGLATGGSKPALQTRLEYFLRAKRFEANSFEPSRVDIEGLSIEDFNVKFENTVAYSISEIEQVIAGLV